jgi:hypothetical protein
MRGWPDRVRASIQASLYDIEDVLARAKIAGIRVQNNGVPLPGVFQTIDLAPGLTAAVESPGVVRITPAPVAGVDVAGLFACAPGSVALRQAVKELPAGATCALAQADTAAAVAIGVCMQVLNPALVLVLFNGELGGFAGLVPDAIYYLDPAVAGGVTNVAPSTPGQIVQKIGRAKDAATLVVEVTAEFMQL